MKKKTTNNKVVVATLLTVIVFVAVAVSLFLRIDTNTQQKTTVAEDDTLHITEFLGYEFGKVYSTHSDMLDKPWFGFLMVYHCSGRPLSHLRFGKDAYDLTAKEDIAELTAAFEKKYGIKMNVRDTAAFYHGKHTTIGIHYYRNEKDDTRGKVWLDISDVKLSNENKQKLESEIRQQQNEDMERM